MSLILYYAPLFIFILVLGWVVVQGGGLKGRPGGKATPKDWVSLVMFFVSLIMAFIGGLLGNSWLWLGPAILLLIVSTLLSNWSPPTRRRQ